MSSVLERPAHAVEHEVRLGEPTWEIARLYPDQGSWTESQYFDLPTNRLVEFRDGTVEVLEMAGIKHQFLVTFLFARLLGHLGEHSKWATFTAPLPLRVAQRAYREPDLMVVERLGVDSTAPALERAEVVFEIVSPSDRGRQRDLVDKRADYAAAGIPEYWIVDPEERTIAVLALEGATYRAAGVYRPGTKAASVLLEGFLIDVAAFFAAGDGVTIAEEPTK